MVFGNMVLVARSFVCERLHVNKPLKGLRESIVLWPRGERERSLGLAWSVLVKVIDPLAGFSPLGGFPG